MIHELFSILFLPRPGAAEPFEADIAQSIDAMGEQIREAGKSLGTATDSYNSAIASFESRVLVSARKFKELGATSREAEIIELRAVEGGTRRLQSVPDKPNEE